MDRNDRINVFSDTINCINKGEYVNKKGETMILPSKFNGLSIEDADFFRKDVKEYIDFKTLKRFKTEIKVVNNDCLYAAKELIDEGFNPVVINNASFKTPGGGVITGSAAQEENICRRSNLVESLYKFDKRLSKEYGFSFAKQAYPLPVMHGAIYSPSISVFKASEDKNYEYLDEPFIIDVITIAALKKPNLTEDGKLDSDSASITKEKIRTMLGLAAYWENDAVVLGAFGCGAFGNPPEEVARLFKEVISEPDYCDKFEKLVFAIIDDKNSYREHNPRGNYIPFKEVFE